MGRINMALWPKFAKAINGDLKILPPPNVVRRPSLLALPGAPCWIWGGGRNLGKDGQEGTDKVGHSSTGGTEMGTLRERKKGGMEGVSHPKREILQRVAQWLERQSLAGALYLIYG